MNTYDCVLLETPLDECLKKSDIIEILNHLPDTNLIPFTVDGHTSTASGFITLQAAETLQYFLAQMDPYAKELCKILNDMHLESKDGTYHILGVSTLMVRNLPEALSE